MPALKPLLSKKAGIEQDGPFADSTRQRPDEWSFLDLPGEIQNEIYLAILEDTGAYLTRDLRIAIPTSLSLASKQIRSQMLGQAMLSVTARVVDFDFAKVITYLNRLPEEDIDLLTPKTTSPSEPERKPKLTIELIWNWRMASGDEKQRFHRWLNRFSVPTKRASGLEIEYVWICDDIRELNYVYLNIARNVSYMLLDEAGKTELRKIYDAVLPAWRAAYQTVEERLANPDFKCECSSTPQNRLYLFSGHGCEHCKLSAEVIEAKPPEESEEEEGHWADL